VGFSDWSQSDARLIGSRDLALFGALLFATFSWSGRSRRAPAVVSPLLIGECDVGLDPLLRRLPSAASTWAVMLIGIVALGYESWRRRANLRPAANEGSDRAFPFKALSARPFSMASAGTIGIWAGFLGRVAHAPCRDSSCELTRAHG
jgi:hypothetical protein